MISSKVLPIAVHGDAAIAGTRYFTKLYKWQLDGYKTGGTIHIVINNQVGFTTTILMLGPRLTVQMLPKLPVARFTSTQMIPRQ
jgi:hypothetical protein